MKMTRPIRIGSRKSRLALVQSEHIAGLLAAASGRPCEIVKIVTRGDVTLDRSLPEIGGKGLFTQELEEQLLDGTIDAAVHSLKDLPTEMPPGLTLGAVSKREDPRDVLASAAAVSFDDLPAGARVGTGSLRRRAQLLRRRDDLTFLDIRGNVPTRLEKLDRGDYDAIVLAAAGLNRLGLSARDTVPFDTDALVPAPGQGALGIECRAGDDDMLAILASVHDPETAVACSIERRVLEMLEGGCNTPVGVHAQCHGDVVRVVAVVASPDASRYVRNQAEGRTRDWEPIADALVADLRAQGAGDIIESTRDAG
jgi:hydroxymethylbilane synthase